MAPPPIVTIAGKVVPGDFFGSHTWSEDLGTGAPSWTWALPPSIAEYVLQQKEVTLEVTRPNGTKDTWQRIVVVKEAESGDPLVRYVTLSNILWYLPKIHVERLYNQRQASGVTRILGTQSQTPAEVLQKAAQITYVPSSLVGGGTAAQGLRPFKADEILRDVLTYIQNRVAKDFGVPGLVFRFRARSRGDYVPNDVLVYGPANVALGHALGIAGGLDVGVTKAGELELRDAFMGAERRAIAAAVNYSLEDMGTLRWIDMGHVAPRAVNVLYRRKVEVRGDVWEQSPTGTQTAVSLANLPILENVAVVTDLQLKDPATGAIYAQGSVIPIDTWFACVNALADAPAWAQLSFTRQTVIDTFFNSLLEDNFVNDPNGAAAPSILWQARISMIRECLRTLYRLNPLFAARCLPGTIEATRCQLVDPATGIYQSSPLYVDHCRRWKAKGQKGEKLHGGNQAFIPPDDGSKLAKGYVKNYGESFPASLVPIAQCYRAPIDVECLDSTLGIFRFAIKKDPYDHIAETIPSLVTQIPTPDAFAVTQGGGFPYWDTAGLSYSHRAIFVFTATPAGSNDENQLHKYAVSYGSALQRLGVSADSVKPQLAAFDVRIHQTKTLCARIAYEDSQRQALLDCYTSPAGANVAATLVPANDLELQDYSTSVAAVLLAAMLNHYEGRATVGFRTDVAPIGALRRVEYTVNAHGELFTTYVCKPVPAPIQPEHFLSAQTRANLFRNLGA